jgi:hypothetical protein
MLTQSRGGAKGARRPDGGAFGRMRLCCDRGGGKGPFFGRAARDEIIEATAAQLLIPELPGRSATRPRRGLVAISDSGERVSLPRCGSRTDAPTGLRSVGGRHTECVGCLSLPHTECAGYGLVAGSRPSALPKKGRTVLERSCAADIRVPASGWGVAGAGAWSLRTNSRSRARWHGGLLLFLSRSCVSVYRRIE